MKKHKFDVNSFSVGDRVVQPDSYDDRYHPNGEHYFGTVSSIEQDGVRVHWDSSWMNTNHSLVPNTEPLYLEADWNKKQSVLEEEFKKVSGAMKAKLETVKTSLLEFHQMADEAGYSFYELRDAMGPLEEAMEHFGWSTSSLYC